MKEIFGGLILGTILSLMLLSFTQVKPKEETIVLSVPSRDEARKQIQYFLDRGYKYKDCIPESVSTSIHDRYTYEENIRDLRGGFIIIMIK